MASRSRSRAVDGKSPRGVVVASVRAVRGVFALRLDHARSRAIAWVVISTLDGELGGRHKKGKIVLIRTHVACA